MGPSAYRYIESGCINVSDDFLVQARRPETISMCGIAGIWFAKGGSGNDLKAAATCMAEAIANRGPDDRGAWSSESAGFALAHRRLAVLDLSQAGHQPMVSGGGGFVISFNGEIYNHLEMRAELEAGGPLQWKGHSDTETLLAGFEQWGVKETLKKTVGMFALALWDVERETLYLARDRFGEKPLYYGWVGEGECRAFAFGSELKALRRHDGFQNPVSRNALAQYMRLLYVPAPLSIYKGIFKLEPGCLLKIQGSIPNFAPEQIFPAPFSHGTLTVEQWWSLVDVVDAASRTQFESVNLALEVLEERIGTAVKLQCLSDVPLGAFLSGGVDSSLVVALMQKQAVRPIKTFTVGFEEAPFNEAGYARAVAQHLGTDHTEMFVSSVEAQSVIDRLPAMYDEPFADSSQIPTHLVCGAARQHVTVALSGDGGDELFGGYNRYVWGPRLWKATSWLPRPVLRAMCATITRIPPGSWDVIGGSINNVLPNGSGVARLGDKAHKFARQLSGARSFDDFSSRVVSEWIDPSQVVRGVEWTGDEVEKTSPKLLKGRPIDATRLMLNDCLGYLPGDILCKVDRAAMSVSLETRVPFLDHRVVEAAWRLPQNMKIRGPRGKWALRQLLSKHVPDTLISRPKAGFAVPIGQWLRGPLRDWAEALLDEKRLLAEGYFYPAPILAKWSEHSSGKDDHTASLWAVLMFQTWLTTQ
jgi:asparagine synthase (glutamine-hydrolysing)